MLAAEAGLAGLADPEQEARYLVGARLGMSPGTLVLRRGETVPEAVARALREDVLRRARRLPADYIIGWKEFSGRRFAVDSRVLVPRPETELLAAEAVAAARAVPGGEPRILDIGTGSGCVAITVAVEVPRASVDAVDVSEEALAVATANAASLGVGNARFLRSDLFAGLPPERRGYFDIIVSNPPYVPTKTITQLEPELSFEPVIALDGGGDGLSVIRRIVAGSAEFLAPGGWLMIEIGFDQGPQTVSLLKAAGFGFAGVKKDLEGNDRIATGVWIGPI